jgi:multisubunit Na+/H+ antiporter MnhE subunit
VDQPALRSPVARGSSLSSRLRFGVAWWAALMAAWLLFVDTFAVAEVLAGVVASALAASLAEAVRERGYVGFAPRARWVAHGPRVVWQILVDCWILEVALVQRLRGRRVRGVMYRVPIRYGGDDSRAAARRALLNFAVSITPNSYVLDLESDTGTALVHQLVPDRLDPLLERDAPEDASPARGDAP